MAATILENLAKFVNYHTFTAFTASHRFFKFLRALQKTDCLEANSLDLNVMAEFAYDVSRDGQRFLTLTPLKQAETAPMSIVLTWTAKLNK